MHVTIVLFPRFTALDAIGPYEVLGRLPGAELIFAATAPGPLRSDQGALTIQVDHALAAIPRTDILLVPGGPGSEACEGDEALLAELRRLHASSKVTASVCTGALILGAAGLLRGAPATTHWALRERLREFGAEPKAERVVRSGKLCTAAGVSAGIDLALTLAGELFGDRVGQAIQLGIEYDPHPPYDVGSLEKAPPELVAAVRAGLS